MADETRHGKALEAQVVADPDELARKESFNVVEQYRAVADMVESYSGAGADFQTSAFSFAASAPDGA